MKTRRTFPMALACAAVALGLVVIPALADELLGRITAVNVDAKKITVSQKDSDVAIQLKVTDQTIFVTPKGDRPVDLAKLRERVEASKKGIPVRVAYEGDTASEVRLGFHKDGDRKDDDDDDRKGDEPWPKRKRERPDP
jgi:hypothetical protein